MPCLWLLVLLGVTALVALCWPAINRMARDRLLTVRNADGSIHFVEEQKVSALRKIAFVFLLVTGTQWLGAALRTPIFQEYVSVEAERTAREYAIWSIIPMVLLYNVLTSLARPQTLVYRICYVYAFVLLLLALYVAVLDANGGKNGVRVFDEELQLPPSLNMNTAPSSFRWVWQQNMRTIVTYTLFIVVETRSVVLNGMIMSFLQLYMGASSKQFSVACFAFMNFWQQIGIMMFLFSGSISYARGRGNAISGSVVLTVAIALVTLLIAEMAVPAYDALEACKLREDQAGGLLVGAGDLLQGAGGGLHQQNNSLGGNYSNTLAPPFPGPAPATAGGAVGILNSNATYGGTGTVGAASAANNGLLVSSTISGGGRVTIRPSTGNIEQHLALVHDPGVERGVNMSPAAGHDSLLRGVASQGGSDHEIDSDHGTPVEAEDLYQHPPSTEEHRPLMSGQRRMVLGAELDRVDTPPNGNGNVGAASINNRVPFCSGEQLSSRGDRIATSGQNQNLDPGKLSRPSTARLAGGKEVVLSLSDRVELLKAYVYKLSGGSFSTTGAAPPTGSSVWAAVRQQVWSSIEGLALTVNHRYVFLLFIVSYSNLPIRQMIDIQLAVLLAGIYPCPPDNGSSLNGPSCSHMKDEKLTLMTVCGLLAGGLNAAVNVMATQELVKKLGVRTTLILNPLVGALCLFVFAGSEFICEHHSWTQLNADKALSYTQTFVPWNDRASLAAGAAGGNVLEGLTAADVVEYGLADSSPPARSSSSSSYGGKVVSYEWSKHLSIAAPPAGVVVVDEQNRPQFEVLSHLSKKAESADACGQLCAQHNRECAYLTFHSTSSLCTLFGKHGRSSSSLGSLVPLPLDPASVFAPGQRAYVVASPKTFEAVAREVQQEGARALVLVLNRAISQVAEEENNNKHTDKDELHILTVVVPDKDWSGKLERGNRLTRIERFPGNDGGLSYLQRYLLVAVFWMLWSSVHFSICGPTVKVKAKSWSHSFGNNLMKMLGNRANNVLNVPLFLVLPSLTVGLGWCAVWLACALAAGSMYLALEEKNEFVGGEGGQDEETL
eukprot:g8148.t1